MTNHFENGRQKAFQSIQNSRFLNITAQQIGRILSSAGLEKAGTKRENFKTSIIGDYEVRHLKIYGLDMITVTPSYMSGTNSMGRIKSALAASGIDFEDKNGTLCIKGNKS
jgi:hypothetical protein